MFYNLYLCNENVQTSSILYSTKCNISVNTNIFFISWLVADKYTSFQMVGVHPKIAILTKYAHKKLYNT